MKRLIQSAVAIGAVLVFTTPGVAAADGCPQRELARVICPNGVGYTYVCQDHPGITYVHSHCFPPGE